ncbi:hypothetical protein, partial [Zooshikella sp. RANM57]|uniref:preprotein translocase subunit SecA n=1 Tax=Zooshikella sp. RANM57 TaxID=3425863 RepID=UPI003D6F752F
MVDAYTHRLMECTFHEQSSERVSQALTKAKIPHEVLNAKFHAREAEIISQAG